MHEYTSIIVNKIVKHTYKYSLITLKTHIKTLKNLTKTEMSKETICRQK